MTDDEQQRSSGCMGKHPFTDAGLAKRVAGQQNRRKDKAKVEAYHCPHCGDWHIGRSGRPIRREKKRAAEMA